MKSMQREVCKEKKRKKEAGKDENRKIRKVNIKKKKKENFK